MKVKYLKGIEADAFVMEDIGYEEFLIMSGKHKNHVLTIETAKYNDGSYDEIIRCSCGKLFYASPLNGAWQMGHQRCKVGRYPKLEVINELPKKERITKSYETIREIELNSYGEVWAE